MVRFLMEGGGSEGEGGVCVASVWQGDGVTQRLDMPIEEEEGIPQGLKPILCWA
jgi:hypothetical protein